MNVESEVIEINARLKMIETQMEALIDVLAKEGMVARIDFDDIVEKKVRERRGKD